MKMACVRLGKFRCRFGFTLLELLVSMSILALLGVILIGTVNSVSGLTQRTTGKIEIFEEGRHAFDRMTHVIGQATLNEYIDYYNLATNKFMAESTGSMTAFIAGDTRRYSDLQFTSGLASDFANNGNLTGVAANYSGHAAFFAAPLGSSTSSRLLTQALNAVGYYVVYEDDSADLPSYISTARAAKSSPSTYHYNLKEVLQPTENASFYSPGAFIPGAGSWINSAAQSSAHTLASNVIALVMYPMEGGTSTTSLFAASSYAYDSRIANATPQPVQQHRLPPNLQITMVVLDKKSATRWCTDVTPPLTKPDAPTGLFTNPDQFKNDLNALCAYLNTKHFNYRVFNTVIPLKSTL